MIVIMVTSYSQDTPVCTLYLVRHGQSQANVDGLFGLDTLLTEEGKKQAQVLAGALRDIHFDAIISSELVRSKQTAETIALERKLAVETKKLLQERHWGSLEGKLKVEIRRDLKHLFELAKTMPDEERAKYKVVPDMESEEEMMDRYVRVLKEIAAAYLGKTVLIVSHQTVMRAFLVHVGYAKYTDLLEGSITNTGYVKLLSNGEGFYVAETQGVKKAESWF
jgi:broad specificity phosphatase PhoE